MSDESSNRVIVNADDLGMSRAVNEAIFESMDAGFVTSATVLANGEEVDAAVRDAAGFPRCSFGVHLNITEGPPLSSPDRLRPLLDESGRLRRAIFDLRPDHALAEAIEVEWGAQVESLYARGLRVTHLDSHEHVHTIPALFFAFKAVQRRFRIRRARVSKNLYCRELPVASQALLVKKAVWNSVLRWNYRTRTTRWFTDCYSLIRAARDGFRAPGTIEAMSHPGATGDPLMATEMRELRSGALDELPIRLRKISYHDL
jgi:predicted glycoside hydrolase/deacetylase ChbG (UPF0249 family)